MNWMVLTGDILLLLGILGFLYVFARGLWMFEDERAEKKLEAYLAEQKEKALVKYVEC